MKVNGKHMSGLAGVTVGEMLEKLGLERDRVVVEALDDPVSKALLVNTVLTHLGGKHVVAGSGMEGTFYSRPAHMSQEKQGGHMRMACDCRPHARFSFWPEACP